MDAEAGVARGRSTAGESGKKQVRRITEAAGDLKGVTTEEVVVGLHIAASRAGVTKITDWTGRELRGYGPEDPLPENRQWRMTITARMINLVTGLTIPTTELPERLLPDIARKKGLLYECRESIGAIEKDLEGTKGPGGFSVQDARITDALNTNGKLGQGWQCDNVRLNFSRTNLAEILKAVRYRVLEVSLECERKDVVLLMPDDGSDEKNGGGKDGKSWIAKVKDSEVTKIVLEGAGKVLGGFLKGVQQ